MPHQIGLQIGPPEACANCLFWRHNRRGKNCGEHRKLKGRAAPGTPADYWCGEYSPLAVARCGDCKHWVDEHLPRKKSPCSQLGLVDGMGKERTEASTYCPSFNQKPAVNLVSNPTIRINGGLSTVMDLQSHSESHSIIIRSDECSGLLVEWVPRGPGKGEWQVAPVALTHGEDPDARHLQEPRIVKYQAVPKGAGEALFAGTVAIGDQEFKGQNSVSKGRVSAIRFAVASNRKRGVATISDGPDGIIETDATGTIQDEPWGPDWDDLKEQMGHLLEAGSGASVAAKDIRKRYEKDTGKRLGSKTAARLEAQLKVDEAIRSAHTS